MAARNRPCCHEASTQGRVLAAVQAKMRGFFLRQGPRSRPVCGTAPSCHLPPSGGNGAGLLPGTRCFHHKACGATYWVATTTEMQNRWTAVLGRGQTSVRRAKRPGTASQPRQAVMLVARPRCRSQHHQPSSSGDCRLSLFRSSIFIYKAVMSAAGATAGGTCGSCGNPSGDAPASGLALAILGAI